MDIITSSSDINSSNSKKNFYTHTQCPLTLAWYWIVQTTGWIYNLTKRKMEWGKREDEWEGWGKIDRTVLWKSHSRHFFLQHGFLRTQPSWKTSNQASNWIPVLRTDRWNLAFTGKQTGLDIEFNRKNVTGKKTPIYLQYYYTKSSSKLNLNYLSIFIIYMIICCLYMKWIWSVYI